MGIFIVVMKCSNWDVIFLFHILSLHLLKWRQKERNGLLHVTSYLGQDLWNKICWIEHPKLLFTYFTWNLLLMHFRVTIKEWWRWLTFAITKKHLKIAIGPNFVFSETKFLNKKHLRWGSKLVFEGLGVVRG